MLKQRVITASIMVSVFVSILFLSPWYVFSSVVGLVFCVAAWEWAGLSGIGRPLQRVSYSLATAGLGLGLYLWLEGAGDLALRNLLVIACTWWAIAILWIQGFPSSAVLWQTRFARAVMGWFVILPAWLSCVHLINLPHGRWLVALIVFIVAAADIGAYFSGRAFGKRKLAPSVSPGKSWEGVWGGMLFSAVVGLVFAYAYSGYWSWVIGLLVLPTAAISVAGDLLESMLKRHTGIKDSSNLLPGHGGVLDRVDGLVAAVPVFTLLMFVTHWSL